MGKQDYQHITELLGWVFMLKFLGWMSCKEKSSEAVKPGLELSDEVYDGKVKGNKKAWQRPPGEPRLKSLGTTWDEMKTKWYLTIYPEAARAHLVRGTC